MRSAPHSGLSLGEPLTSGLDPERSRSPIINQPNGVSIFSVNGAGIEAKFVKKSLSEPDLLI